MTSKSYLALSAGALSGLAACQSVPGAHTPVEVGVGGDAAAAEAGPERAGARFNPPAPLPEAAIIGAREPELFYGDETFFAAERERLSRETDADTRGDGESFSFRNARCCQSSASGSPESRGRDLLGGEQLAMLKKGGIAEEFKS